MGGSLPYASKGIRRLKTVGFLAVATLATVVCIWESQRSTQRPKIEPLSRPPGDSTSSLVRGEDRIADYVGAAACLECHPGESSLHDRSGHSRTLRQAERSPIIAWLSGQTVSDPERPAVRWSYQLRDNKLIVDRTIEGRTESLALDYSVGSGKHGITFVSVQRQNPEIEPSGLEHRLSYFPDGPRLDITPGQEASDSDGHHGETDESTAFGNPLDPTKLQKCIGCHATLTSTADPHRLETATLLPNVSCERCHGPGRDHVDAARRGETDLRMRMGSDPVRPWVEVNLCGECHRLPRSVRASALEPSNQGIVRFQGVGVSMSACYEEGLGGLRCTTCHDPHDRASSDHAHYEAACLSCHRSASGKKTCQISPATNCIGCHMPRRELPGKGTFTDHWIRNPSVPALESADPPKAAQPPRP